MSACANPLRRAVLSVALTAASAAVVVVAPNSSASAAPSPNWAADGKSTIHPGVNTNTKDQVCTSNFVFLDAKSNAYLGQAAHCSSEGEATDINGCTAKSFPEGTEVALGESGVTGTLAYNSWRTMQMIKEKNEDICLSNDFALIRIPDDAVKMSNPSLPFFGGPTGLRTTELAPGEPVLSYGNSPLRGGLMAFSPKQGINLSTDLGGRAHTVFTVTPGVPGDSGSGFLDSSGRAFGVLSTLSFAPIPGSNGVADLAMALAYAQQHSGIEGLRLANGTADFASGVAPPMGG